MIPYFQDLKNYVLQTAQIKDITSSDCRILASTIFSKTQKQISQTTIKRLYGFAALRFNPSTYTLNTLAAFCGYLNWRDFTAHIDGLQNKKATSPEWHHVAHSAHAITHFTMQANKRKCGIPFSHTIARKELNEHINNFQKSPHTACVISAPSGTGKTIGITHWIESQMTKQQEGIPSKDIFLLINSSALYFSANFGFQGSKWLAHLLHLPSHKDLECFMAQYEHHAPGHFYLIIDDFNAPSPSHSFFTILFQQLIDLISYLAAYPWVKVLVSLHPLTWQKQGYLIEQHTALHKLWFTNFNLKGFNRQELYLLSDQIDKTNCPSLASLLDKQVQYDYSPLHFQYLYQLKNTVKLDHLDHLAEYLIHFSQLNYRVFKGAFAAEKHFLLQQFTSLAHSEPNSEPYILRKDVYPFIKTYRAPYQELLRLNILQEFQEQPNARYHIRFQNTLLLAYFIAQEQLHKKAHHPLNVLFREQIMSARYTPQLKISIIKWLIFFITEKGKLKNMHLLDRMNAIPEWHRLISPFIAQCLAYFSQRPL